MKYIELSERVAVESFDWDTYTADYSDHVQALEALEGSVADYMDSRRVQVALESITTLTKGDCQFMVTAGLLPADTVALEAYSNPDRLSAATANAESFARKVIEAIKKFFKWLLDTAKKFYNRVAEGLGRIERDAKRIRPPAPGDYPLVGRASREAVRHLQIGGAVDLSKLPSSDNTMIGVLHAAVAIDAQLTAAITTEQFDDTPEIAAERMVANYYGKIASKLVGEVCGGVELERTETGLSLVLASNASEPMDVECTNANDWNNLTNTHNTTLSIADARKEAEQDNKRLRSLLDVLSKSDPATADKRFALISRIIVFREKAVSAVTNNMVSALRYRLELAKTFTSASNGSN